MAIRELLDRSSRKFNVTVVSFAVVFRDVTQQSPKRTPQKTATRGASTTADKWQTHGKNKNANEWKLGQSFVCQIVIRDSGQQNDGKFHARPGMHSFERHFFRHSAVLSLLAVVLCEVSVTSYYPTWTKHFSVGSMTGEWQFKNQIISIPLDVLSVTENIFFYISYRPMLSLTTYRQIKIYTTEFKKHNI